MDLQSELPEPMWDELVQILKRRDPFILSLLVEHKELTPAQLSILADITAAEVSSSFDRDGVPSMDSDRLEALHVAVYAALPVPRSSRRWAKGEWPFDRYEQYGEIRPPEHPPRPLRPGGYQPEPEPLFDPKEPPTKLFGYNVEALDQCDALGISPSLLKETFYNPNRVCVPDPVRGIWIISDDRFELEVKPSRSIQRFRLVESD